MSDPAFGGLHVGVVARCLNTDHVRGMGKYVMELLKHSASGADTLRWHLMADDPAHPLLHPDSERVTAEIFEQRGDRFRLWEQWALPRRARQLGLNLLHCTEGALPLMQPVPTVVTLHDTLAFEERPNTLGQKLYWDHLIPAALRRAAHVITISECSKRDILARWPELEDRLTVIYHGIDAAYFEPTAAALPKALTDPLGPSPYLVYLGGPMARKRFDWAVQVLEAQPNTQLKLVACGFGAKSREEARQSLAPSLRERVVFAPFLSDAELIATYRAARAVLYPTLYEGFGFPAIEAQASGVPVIFSALGSLAELAGPLALIEPAQDLAAWAAAVQRADEMPASEREALAAQARSWAQGFQWARSHAAHVAVYRQVAAQTGQP